MATSLFATELIVGACVQAYGFPSALLPLMQYMLRLTSHNYVSPTFNPYTSVYTVVNKRGCLYAAVDI